MQAPWNEALETLALSSQVSKPARITLMALSRADDQGNAYFTRGELSRKFGLDPHVSDAIRRAVELGLLREGSSMNWLRINMPVFAA